MTADAADALRMERDAAHEECARLTAERDRARGIAVARSTGGANSAMPTGQARKVQTSGRPEKKKVRWPLVQCFTRSKPPIHQRSTS